MAQNPLRLMTILLLTCTVVSTGFVLDCQRINSHAICCGHAGGVPSMTLWNADAFDWDKTARAVGYPVWTEDRAEILRDDRTRNLETRDQYGRNLALIVHFYLGRNPLNHWYEQVNERAAFAGGAAIVSALLAVWTGLLAKRWRAMKEAIARVPAAPPPQP